MNKEKRASELSLLKNSVGFQILREEMEARIRDGWEEFIDLPPEKKISKAAYHYQAKYKVLKDLLEWIEEEIRAGQRFTPQPERAGVGT